MNQVQKLRNYEYQGVLYEGTITYKRGMRNIVTRIDPEKRTVKVSCPYYVSLRSIDDAVTGAFPKLLKRQKGISKAFQNGQVLFLGEWMEVGDLDQKALSSLLKKKALPIFEARVRYYEKLMGVQEPYKVKVRDMTSRYGVNSRRTHAITFQTKLIHYPLPVIDTVVVHELAHHFVFDHSPRFYEVVYHYCPSYKEDHRYLVKHKYD